MSATIRDIYTKAIDVVRSCKTIHQVESATKYVDLAIKRIDSEKSKSKSIKLMVSNLEYYLRMKKKAIML
jgi:hypothetical protein